MLANIFLISLVAGLGTGLGGLIVILKKPSKRAFGFLMGITSGVMITLAFLELVNKSWEQAGFLTATIGFGTGAVFMFLVDYLTPHIRFGEREGEDVPRIPAHAEQGQKCRQAEELSSFSHQDSAQPASGRMFQHHHRHGARTKHQRIVNYPLFRTGLLIAFGIAIHNIPEGVAVGAGYMHAPKFGIFIALAIALHNIPEGIATALPLYSSGFGRWKALGTAFLSGLAEPIGAILAVLFLSSFSALIPGALAFAGGVMTFITLDELIPAARMYGHEHSTAMGIILGSIFVFLLSGLVNI